MAKIKYSGSANSVPAFGITMADGDTLEVDDSTAERLVAQGIGFSYAEKAAEAPRRKKKDEGD